MNNVIHDNLIIYGEYARKSKRVNIDFLAEFFITKLSAEHSDVASSEIRKMLQRSVRSRKGEKESI